MSRLLYPFPSRRCCSKLKLIVRCSVTQWVDRSCEQILWIWKLVTDVLSSDFARTLTNKGQDCVGRWEVMFPGDRHKGFKCTLDSLSLESLRKCCLATCTCIKSLRVMVAFWFDCQKGNWRRICHILQVPTACPRAWPGSGLCFAGTLVRNLEAILCTLALPHVDATLQHAYFAFVVPAWLISLWRVGCLLLKCPSADGGCWYRGAWLFVHVYKWGTQGKWVEPLNNGIIKWI